jgi:hypothetical protein
VRYRCGLRTKADLTRPLDATHWPQWGKATSTDGLPAGDQRGYQFVAVAASTSPTDASQRSASIAALQPSPAAVTAWR